MMWRMWLDRSRESILACCTCGWREFAWTDTRGWEAAADHDSRVHSGEGNAHKVIQKRRSRERAA